MVRLIREGYFDYWNEIGDFIKQNMGAIERAFEKCGFYNKVEVSYSHDDGYSLKVAEPIGEESGDSTILKQELNKIFKPAGFCIYKVFDDRATYADGTRAREVDAWVLYDDSNSRRR